ncbi:MAG: BamA/TamA family outer membrane protein, partial [Kofleriaceae bacterium]|nr:BamA/TamA family outer membrane protein [Kofleriaceae bacterium]
AEDSLATETILSSVPPFDNIEQLHVRPAGGNIRGLASLDAQLRIFSAFASAVFIDSGVVTNRWRDVQREKIRFGVGMAFARVVTGFGSLTFEYAVPIAPQLGDDPRGRWHLGFAMRF